MKLTIKRGQKTTGGFLSRSRICFTVNFSVELDPSEKALVEQYKLGEETLGMHLWLRGNGAPSNGSDFLNKLFGTDIVVDRNNGDQYLRLTVNSLITGKTVEADPKYNIGLLELLALEKTIVKSCEQLKQLMEIMKKYGNSEVVNFDEKGNSTYVGIEI